MSTFKPATTDHNTDNEKKNIATYIETAKYARHIEHLNRRETWEEACDRVMNMHIRRFPRLEPKIVAAFDMVREKKILPSMRSMQFGGEAIAVNNARMFNCTFTHIDRPRVFGEAMWLLLCGSGTGYSVQKHHVKLLPPIAGEWGYNRTHQVEDTIEGWADAVNALINAAIEGADINFDYSIIRQKGSPLKTSGGKAPGPEPLRRALERIRTVIEGAKGRHLQPIECHDILCHCADAVLSGGIRRSAMIALFSLDDEEMLMAKAGEWYLENPQRSKANNSAVFLRDSAWSEKKNSIQEYRDHLRAKFQRVMKINREWGEPGVYFTNSLEYGANPCVEIGLNPVLTVTADNINRVALQLPSAYIGQKITGWQGCNLSTINLATVEDNEDFIDRCEAASFIGTLQADYTNLHYLGPVSSLLFEREALIGVSLTGMMDAPSIAFDKKMLRAGAAIVQQENRKTAREIGINPAPRTTCVKPEGTSSLVLGGIAYGIHPHHATEHFRRIRASILEGPARYVMDTQPERCHWINEDEGTFVINFALKHGADTITRDDVKAIEFLQHVLLVQKYWVEGAFNSINTPSPGLQHNVSNTCTVRGDEWEDVIDFVWDNRDTFGGLSFLGYYGDSKYPTAPYQALLDDEDKKFWARLRSLPMIDFTGMVETEDNTNLVGELACGGGTCDI